MSNPRAILAIAVCTVCIARAAAPVEGIQATPQAELAQIVTTLGRVASLYRDAALSFACQERIVDSRYRANRLVGRRTHRFDYFYVYNDERAVAESAGTLRLGLGDYRTHRPDDDDPLAGPVRVDPADMGVAAHLQRAYSWIFIFQPGGADLMRFTLAGTGEALGRAAWIIEFEPGDEYIVALNDWFGRAWIDQETYQLLRVEAAKSDEVRERLAAGDVLERGRFLFTQVRVAFDAERNGLRFPSDATLVGARAPVEAGGDEAYRVAARAAAKGLPTIDRVFRVQQQYRDYRFFSVQTAAEVNATIKGIIR